jgi:hypothetical protein
MKQKFLFVSSLEDAAKFCQQAPTARKKGLHISADRPNKAQGRESHLPPPNAHAIVLAGSIPALRERDARLGGTRKDEDSFPLTDAGNSARRRMFRAAFTSRSCGTPHAAQVHRLTRNPLTPCGPVKASQFEQVRLEFLSFTIWKVLPASLALVLQTPSEHTPSGIQHGLRHPCFHQLGTAHIAHHDLLILIHYPAAELMQRILAPVCRSSM